MVAAPGARHRIDAMRLRQLALPLLVVVAATAVAKAQSELSTFLVELQKAIQFKDEKLLDRNVKARPREALLHYYGLVRSVIWGRPEEADAARPTKESIEQSWDRVFKTRTLSLVERYYSSLDGNTLRELDRIATSYDILSRRQAEARASHQREQIMAAHEDITKLAAGFESLGHKLFAADCWEWMAVLLTALPEPTVGERRDAIYALARYEELRKSWEFTEDEIFKGNMAWKRSVEAELAGAEAKAKEREAAGIAGDAKGAEQFIDPNVAEVVADLEFEVMKKPIDDCFVLGGEIAPAWNSVRCTGETPGKFAFFQAQPLFLVRMAATKFGVTWDETGAGAQEVDASSRPKPSQFWLDSGKTKPYAMWFYLPGDKERYMGIEVNMAPQTEFADVFFKSAASWHADVDGTPVTLYDSNGDGRLFLPDPHAFGLQPTYVLMGEQLSLPSYDSMRVGRAGTVQPYSEFVEIGDAWYHLRAAKDGAALSARKVVADLFPTGAIKMVWRGPRKPAVLVVRGEGVFAGTSVNLASGKAVAVPAGMWDIEYGRLEEGKGAAMISAAILRGDSKPIEVKAGETVTIELGAPFQFHLAKEQAGVEVQVDLHKMRLRGASGELYTLLNGCVPEMDILFARDEKGRGAKSIGELVPVQGDEMVQVLRHELPEVGFFAPMWPVVKGQKDKPTVFRFHPPGPGVLGLQAKKAKLFGKIEPLFQ